MSKGSVAVSLHNRHSGGMPSFVSDADVDAVATGVEGGIVYFGKRLAIGVVEYLYLVPGEMDAHGLGDRFLRRPATGDSNCGAGVGKLLLGEDLGAEAGDLHGLLDAGDLDEVDADADDQR